MSLEYSVNTLLRQILLLGNLPLAKTLVPPLSPVVSEVDMNG